MAVVATKTSGVTSRLVRATSIAGCQEGDELMVNSPLKEVIPAEVESHFRDIHCQWVSRS